MSINAILDDWAGQRNRLGDLDEASLKTLIATELKRDARKTILIAAHQRQSRLRTSREREALEARIEKRREAIKKAQARDARKKR